jgi:hypothetical protein
MNPWIPAALIAGLCVGAAAPQDVQRLAGAEARVVSVQRLISMSIGKREYPGPGGGLVGITIEVTGDVKERLKELKSVVLRSVLSDSEGRTARPLDFHWSSRQRLEITFETARNAELKTLQLESAAFDLSGFPGSAKAREGTIEGTALTFPRGRPLVAANLLLMQSGKPAARAATDEAGRFRFDNVLPGSYLITAEGGNASTMAWRENGDAVVVGVGARGQDLVAIGTVYLPDLNELAVYRGLCESTPKRLRAMDEKPGPEQEGPKLVVLSRDLSLAKWVKGAGDWAFDVSLRSELSPGLRPGRETLVCVTMLVEIVGYYRLPLYQIPAGLKTWLIRVGQPGTATWQDTTIVKEPAKFIDLSRPGAGPVQDLKAWLATVLAGR